MARWVKFCTIFHTNKIASDEKFPHFYTFFINSKVKYWSFWRYVFLNNYSNVKYICKFIPFPVAVSMLMQISIIQLTLANLKFTFPYANA